MLFFYPGAMQLAEQDKTISRQLVPKSTIGRQ